jgi:mannose-6-phosphate isomerase-like protein (cupin superfamily)
MALPTAALRPDRVWQGQRFVHNRAAEGRFLPCRLPGFAARDTTIAAGTGGLASVRVLRPDGAAPAWVAHQGDILFSFVLSGRVTLEGRDRDPVSLEAGDAFVIPPGLPTRLGAGSPDLELLEVSLPGDPVTLPA